MIPTSHCPSVIHESAGWWRWVDDVAVHLVLGGRQLFRLIRLFLVLIFLILTIRVSIVGHADSLVLLHLVLHLVLLRVMHPLIHLHHQSFHGCVLHCALHQFFFRGL